MYIQVLCCLHIDHDVPTCFKYIYDTYLMINNVIASQDALLVPQTPDFGCTTAIP